jgi:hypothetical protein
MKLKRKSNPDNKAWAWYENIIHNLSGSLQIYRFFDRLASVEEKGMTFRQQMDAFLKKYPQYNIKKDNKKI